MKAEEFIKTDEEYEWTAYDVEHKEGLYGLMEAYASEENKELREFMREVDAWLSFNTQPSKEQILQMRKSIQDKLNKH